MSGRVNASEADRMSLSVGLSGILERPTLGKDLPGQKARLQSFVTGHRVSPNNKRQGTLLL